MPKNNLFAAHSSSLQSPSLREPMPPPLHRERLYDAAAERKHRWREELSELPFGAEVTGAGVRYRIWCPGCASLAIEIQSANGDERSLETVRDEEGYRVAMDPEGRAGDAYRLRLPCGSVHADPVARAQRDTVTGYSLVVDPKAYAWQDKEWRRPPFRDLVIYELHVGTFTPAGTFLGVIEKLPALKELGVRAIELMPIADFPGLRNWGYDGVLIYAPARAYGSPEDLRRLVDAAHALGLAVIQDVVYNHMGPDGSSLNGLAREYFHPTHQTPWGAAFNFDGANSQPVREFFAGNAEYWMREFHMDGVRLDATHAIADSSAKHILAEISERVHALGGYVIAEDERNEVRLVEPPDRGGFGFDAVWADDFHHVIRVSQTKEQHAYLQNFSGTLDETVDTLQCGWRFRGQLAGKDGKRRGTECSHVPPEKLIHCISNHDQVGNQAFGTRLSSNIPEANLRAISMLLCLSPYTPMLFMGQEWAATTPFLFFTDHNEELGKLITEGRRKEFAAFPEFADEAQRGAIPDPQSEVTFLKSKLNWEELNRPKARGLRALHAAALRLRREIPVLRPVDRRGWEVRQLQEGVGCIRYESAQGPYLLLFHLWPTGDLVEIDLEPLLAGGAGCEPRLLLSSNAAEFGGSGTIPRPGARSYVFGDAETLLFHGCDASLTTH